MSAVDELRLWRNNMHFNCNRRGKSVRDSKRFWTRSGVIRGRKEIYRAYLVLRAMRFHQYETSCNAYKYSWMIGVLVPKTCHSPINPVPTADSEPNTSENKRKNNLLAVESQSIYLVLSCLVFISPNRSLSENIKRKRMAEEGTPVSQDPLFLVSERKKPSIG